MVYKTINDIAIELNLSTRTIGYRFQKLGITGKKIIRTVYYTPMEVHRISYKKHINPSYPLLSSPNLYNNQVDIINMYLQNKNYSAAEISSQLCLSIYTIDRTIKLYKERKCLIIQSRL